MSELGGIICNLVRRPQSGLTRVLFRARANEQAWREHTYRSMRAVETTPAASLNTREEVNPVSLDGRT